MTDENTQEPEAAKAEETLITYEDMLAGKDLEGKSMEELIEIIKGERSDAAGLLSKYGMGLMLNSGLYGAAKKLVDARLPHPKHDEKSKTFLVYKEEFTDLVRYLDSADTDFHELVVGDMHIQMKDVIDGYAYILEQRKNSAEIIAKDLNAERDQLYHKVNFLLTNLVQANKVEAREGFDLVMTEATKFVDDMIAASAGKSGAQVAKEKLEQEKADADSPPTE